jgi:hypothetical protein
MRLTGRQIQNVTQHGIDEVGGGGFVCLSCLWQVERMPGFCLADNKVHKDRKIVSVLQNRCQDSVCLACVEG